MATRSLIARKKDDYFEVIYCHYDGYPEHNGAILKNHYTENSKIDALFELGNLSVLGTEIGEKHDFDDVNYEKNWCTSYKRDRNDNDNEKQIVYTQNDISKLALNSCAEFIYIYLDDRWEYKNLNRVLTNKKL